MYMLTESSFRLCSPYKTEGMLDDYLSAFVGAVNMRFQTDQLPTVKVKYLGSRPLTPDEEKGIIGKPDSTDSSIKGVDALSVIMNIAVDEGYFGYNKMFYVITWLNITEEKTKPIVNDNAVIPGSSSSEDYETSEEDDTISKISVRSGPSKQSHSNVGGLTQYGKVCTGTGAIGQDNGKYFSGVDIAAAQIATALGPMYNGSIARRTCGQYYMEEGSEFHKDECSSISQATLSEGDFECLKDEVNAANNSVKTPKEFFEKYPQWTPCGVSFSGSETCGSLQAKAQEDCKIQCCFNPNYFNLSLNLISAPDGTICNSDQICVGGKCISGISTRVEG
uniref:Putative metalloprotease n=1 Tax=Ixodes ricinus TaxID=34613 RepID=A0A0K8REU1_IXORI